MRQPKIDWYITKEGTKIYAIAYYYSFWADFYYAIEKSDDNVRYTDDYRKVEKFIKNNELILLQKDN